MNKQSKKICGGGKPERCKVIIEYTGFLPAHSPIKSSYWPYLEDKIDALEDKIDALELNREPQTEEVETEIAGLGDALIEGVSLPKIECVTRSLGPRIDNPIPMNVNMDAEIDNECMLEKTLLSQHENASIQKLKAEFDLSLEDSFRILGEMKQELKNFYDISKFGKELSDKGLNEVIEQDLFNSAAADLNVMGFEVEPVYDIATEPTLPDEEEDYRVPEQIVSTNEKPDRHKFKSARLRFMEDLLEFLPDMIRKHIVIFEHMKDAKNLNDKPLFPDCKNDDIPVILFLSGVSSTTNMSYIGIESLFDNVNIETVPGLEEALDEMQCYVLDEVGDLSLYDNYIDLPTIMSMYDDIGAKNIVHNNGRKIFNRFVQDNGLNPIHLRMPNSTDIHKAYYKDHVLFVPDLIMNHVRIRVIDVLSDLETEFREEEKLADGGKVAHSTFTNSVDIEYGDDIINNIRDFMFFAYEKAFLKYNMQVKETDM